MLSTSLASGKQWTFMHSVMRFATWLGKDATDGDLQRVRILERSPVEPDERRLRF